MNDFERQLLQDIHEKVADMQVSMSVLAERTASHRIQCDKSLDDLDAIKRKVFKVEGAMWIVTIIFAALGLIAKFVYAP